MVNTIQKLSVCLLLLCCLVGNGMAQSDQTYVIKRTKYNSSAGDHYLAHVKVGTGYVLQDATTFSPDCIWYSGRDFNVMGTHHNYYFIDDQNQYRFLSAPLSSGGQLSISPSLPEVYLLNNTDHNYYFYDWDSDNGSYGAGLARGHQYNGITNQTACEACEGGKWDATDEECWAVYWVELNGNTWKLSTTSQYNITDNSGRYRLVTVTSFPLQVSTAGGLEDLSDFDMEFSSPSQGLSASITPFTYIPAYKKYVFDEVTTPKVPATSTSPAVPAVIETRTFYYPSGNNTNTSVPTTPVSSGDQTQWTHAWSISGEGAQFLSFSNGGTQYIHTSSLAAPTLYYRTANSDGHKTATLTLTVTYQDGSTQTKSCTVTVKTPCQNPQFSAKVSYENVILSWTQTADSYTVSYKKTTDTQWTSVPVGNVTADTLTGLAYSTMYDYKVKAACDPAEPDSLQFTTPAEPEAMICGAVFGGGRMADVTGNTEVVIVNADSIGAVYGGNDIAGEVKGDGGSTIVLGVDASNDAASYSYLYNGGNASTKVRVGDVYGGGNGYYAYNGTSFVAALASATTATVANNDSVASVNGNSVWINKTGAEETLTLPTIKKTAITMTNDVVKVDSVFGGAKNAFITNNNPNANGTSITVKGGTAFAVYGGNNYGGTQTDGKHYIKVEGTKTNTDTYPTGLGRDFGIAYLFGGGNKVAGLTTDVEITGGMCDTVFGGGNAADVAASNVTVDCSIASGTAPAFGNTYSNAIQSYDGTTLTIKETGYAWNGTGIYNVRILFGGNNRANMAGLPVINLTSGSVGTVYGGGNAGDMLAQTPDDVDPTTNPGTGPLAIDFDSPMVGSTKYPIYYGTHVVMDQANMIVDYLYGGCQMSDVEYSTWVEIKNGHVGTVYGGCNVSGDVGSEPRIAYDQCDTDEKYQLVKGATYVKATGGTIHGDLFAGSNGFYHCNDGVRYIEGHNYTSSNYIGDTIPSHNETHVMVSKDDVNHTSPTVKGNVYAGGNMAYVGFINETDQGYRFRDFVGFSSVRMDGGVVEGSVYGGGNRASIFGSNEVRVSGGSIGYIGDTPTDGALYGGNDRAGQVAQITNRVLPVSYGVASDDETNLNLLGVKTYVGLTGKPRISTVYGGGNGAYTDYNSGIYCDSTDKPVQSNTFVDINIDADGGSGTGGYINTVYGGGNGVTVLDRITVFVNVENAAANAYDQIGTIFGGNNQGDLDILSDLILLHGQVNTVYGGCNSGAMLGNLTYEGYEHIGSAVRLLDQYRPNGTGNLVIPDAKVTGAVYGGCRMNDVANNSLVLVEAGTHPASMFGGCDISGTVGGTSRVVVKNGTNGNNTTVGNIYGGGNGNYYYEGNKVYRDPDHLYPVDSIESGNITAPVCAVSRVDVLEGQVGTSDAHKDIFGGGLGELTHTLGNVLVNIGDVNHMNVAGPTVFGDVYGGSALGKVNNNSNYGSDSTIVNIINGDIYGDIYGGGLGDTLTGHVVEAKVFGKTYVNIGTDEDTGNISLKTYVKDGKTYGANVYGCNNLNGSPLDSVFVNIYKTAHINTIPNYDTCPNINTLTALQTNASTQNYAIQAVYGGGNLAAYTPSLTTSSEPKCTTVHVYTCQNTVKDVYGGGNAANVGTQSGAKANTFVIIDGGRFNRIFNGGNGAVSPASIYGTATADIKSGLADQVFGGGNMQGSIDSTSLLLSHSNLGCSNEVFSEVFGGGNQAPFIGNLNTTIDCGVGTIGSLYGGANLADITGDVTLTIQGGDFKEVYGGSKGATQAANITGNVTLNLQGGSIIQAFGGSNVNGNITGLITVNVDTIAGACPLVLDTLFGSGNLTAYTPNLDNGNLITSPIVNVKNGTVRRAVFGSGKGSTAIVTANPQVNIGDADNNVNRIAQVGYLVGTTIYGGDVYGGGYQGAVNGGPVVNVQKANTLVYHQVFGGGDMANVDSTVVNIHNGTVKAGVYGGCNVEGNVGGDIEVNVFDGVLGVENARMDEGIFGGGLGQPTSTSGNVTVNIGDASHAPTLYADVYGGSALGQVNAADKQTTVNFAKGKLYGDLYGGGLGQALPEIAALVHGNVVVNLGKDKAGTVMGVGDTIVGSVFGANNVKGTPLGNVTVNLVQGVVDSIFGGGNQAAYVPTASGTNFPAVNISGGTVTHKVVGGGNAADIGSSSITVNPHVNISGGNVCTVSTGANAGVYGGCNASGTVYGDITLSVTNANGNTVIGTMTALQALNPVGVYGGGFGDGTTTTGNVTVTYGSGGELGTDSDYPMLYGDLYGGSALGTVNASPANTTTVTVLNGSVKFHRVDPDNYGGNIYGGGRGEANVMSGTTISVDNSAKGQVNGVVHVNIGEEGVTPGTVIGKANLKGCNVFGCNNTNGSPQQEVYVDVYQTHHTLNDSISASGMSVDNYAIRNVYGGGNKAHFGEVTLKKTFNTIHGCENTIENVYGGGNAANTYGTVVAVDGGRYKYVFGGGNGQTTPANIGDGGVNIAIYGGHIGWYFNGCNLHGTVGGGNPVEQYGCTDTYCPCGDSLIVENYYFGANEALTVGGLSHIINCGDNMNFLNVYAGSRLAVVYGDVKLWVRGGTIGNLYGGNEGSNEVQADVKKFPEQGYDWTTNPDGHPIEVKQYLDTVPSQYGKGGNIQLVLQGGQLGNVYGGNNYRGNVEGDIVIIVDSTQASPCQLSIDNLYGGNNKAAYTPDSLNHQVYLNPNRISPQVYLKKGNVTHDVYGGSEGGDPSHEFGNGIVVSNSLVVIGDPNSIGDPDNKGVCVGGDVFGGGMAALLEGNPVVVLQGKATVGGDVFGGGKESDITGTTDVRIAPTTTVTPPETPIPPKHNLEVQIVGNGSVKVIYFNGLEWDTVNTSASSHVIYDVPEGSILSIEATPAAGHTFKEWWTDFGRVEQVGELKTQCLMGPKDTILKATFE